jgi:hypothetical protein
MFSHLRSEMKFMLQVDTKIRSELAPLVTELRGFLLGRDITQKVCSESAHT